MNRNFQAKKSLGQNFLEDPGIVARIIESVRAAETDTIVEIGPGRGVITERLVEAAGKVIAVELDRELAPALRLKHLDNGKLEVLEADALTIDFRDLSAGHGSKLRVVANLPYNISTAILQRLIEYRDCFSDMTLMFQLEVVERITAPAGSSGRGFLTVLVEAFFESEKLFEVPPSAFRPIPKVQSAVVRLVPRTNVTLDVLIFRDLVSVAFAQKRKTISNNLKVVYEDNRELLASADIDPARRAETLTLDEWHHLYKSAQKFSKSN